MSYHFLNADLLKPYLPWFVYFDHPSYVNDVFSVFAEKEQLDFERRHDTMATKFILLGSPFFLVLKKLEDSGDEAIGLDKE